MFGQLFAFAEFHCQRCNVEKKALTARNGICKGNCADFAVTCLPSWCVCVWVCMSRRWGNEGGGGLHVFVCMWRWRGSEERETEREGGGRFTCVCVRACIPVCAWLFVCVCVRERVGWGGRGGGGEALQRWRWENDTHNPTMNIFVHHIFCHTFTYLSLWVLKTLNQSAQKHTPPPHKALTQSKCLPKQF